MKNYIYPIIVVIVFVCVLVYRDEEFREKMEISNNNILWSIFNTIKEEPESETNTNNIINSETQHITPVQTNPTGTVKENEAVQKKSTAQEKEVVQEQTSIPEKSLGIINYVNNDGSLIPDKYNSGVNPNIPLKQFNIGDEFIFKIGESTFFNGRETLPASIINMSWSQNEEKSGTYVIENTDFSKYVFRMYSSKNRTTDITIVFRNCNFGSVVISPEMNDHIKLVFENCTFARFGGSNATIVNSKFNVSTGDAINPYKNVNVKNTYIAFSSVQYVSSEIHLDGIQIYGKENLLATNIHFYNTRIELPYLLTTNAEGAVSKTYVNAPLMLQLEFSSGSDISFENMYINGGGFSIYTRALKGFTYNNIRFKNIKTGEGHVYGILYGRNDYVNVKMTNVVHTPSLYVSSIWKDDNGVHIITTNDTVTERKMICKTNVGDYTFTVKAHPVLTKATSTSYSLNDLPYDIDEIINNKKINRVSCYDVTNGSEVLIGTHNF